MNHPLIIHGTLHSPFFTFIHCGDSLSDADLLECFGLSRYVPAREDQPSGVYVILSDHGEWKLLADCWLYTLWSSRKARPAVEELARQYDVFTCSVGDSDNSFDFAYYRAGELVRKCVAIDPDFRGARVTENFGVPLPGEPNVLTDEPDILGMVLGIATSVGINTDFTNASLRVYAKPSTTSQEHRV